MKTEIKTLVGKMHKASRSFRFADGTVLTAPSAADLVARPDAGWALKWGHQGPKAGVTWMQAVDGNPGVLQNKTEGKDGELFPLRSFDTKTGVLTYEDTQSEKQEATALANEECLAVFS